MSLSMNSRIENFTKKIENNQEHIGFFDALKSISNPENLPKTKLEAALFYYASSLGLNPKSATSDYLQTVFSLDKRKVYGVYYEGAVWKVNSVKTTDRWIEKGASLLKRAKKFVGIRGQIVGNGWVVGDGPATLTKMIATLEDKSKNNDIFYPRQQNKYVRNKAYDVATILRQGAKAFDQMPELRLVKKKEETKQVIEKAVTGIMDTRKRVILTGLSKRAIHSQQVSLESIPASITYSQGAFTLYYLAVMNNPGSMQSIHDAIQPTQGNAMTSLAAIEYLRTNYFREKDKLPFWWDKDNKRWYYRSDKPIALGLTPTAFISISEKLSTDAARGDSTRSTMQSNIKTAESLFEKINGLKQVQEKETQQKRATQERADQTQRLIESLPYSPSFTANFAYKYILSTEPAFKEGNGKLVQAWSMLKLDDSHLLSYNSETNRYVAFSDKKWMKVNSEKATELIKKYYGVGKFNSLSAQEKKLTGSIRKLNSLVVSSGKFTNEQDATKILAGLERPEMAGTFTFNTLNHTKLRKSVREQVEVHYQKDVAFPIVPGVRAAIVNLESQALFQKLQQTIEAARKSKKYTNTEKISYSVKKDGSIIIVKGEVVQPRPGNTAPQQPTSLKDKATAVAAKAAKKASQLLGKALGPFKGLGTFIKSHWTIAAEQVNKAEGWKAKISAAAGYFFKRFIPSAGKSFGHWIKQSPMNPVYAAGAIAAPVAIFFAWRKWRRYVKRLKKDPKTPRPKISIPEFVKIPVRAIFNILPRPVKKGLVGMLGAGVVVGLGLKTAEGKKALSKLSKWGEGRYEQLKRFAIKKIHKKVTTLPDKKIPTNYNYMITQDWTVDRDGIFVPHKGYMYIADGSTLYVRQSDGSDKQVTKTEAYALIRAGGVTFSPTKTIFKAGTIFVRKTRKLHPRKGPRN